MKRNEDWQSLSNEFRSCLALPESKIEGVLRDLMVKAGKLLWPWIDKGSLPSIAHFSTNRTIIWDDPPSADSAIMSAELRWVVLWFLACRQLSRRVDGFPSEPIPSEYGMPPRPGEPRQFTSASAQQNSRYYAEACQWLAENLGKKTTSSLTEKNPPHRPRDTDPEHDQKVYDDWKTARAKQKNLTYAQFAAGYTEEITGPEVKAAVDRHAKRLANS